MSVPPLTSTSIKSYDIIIVGGGLAGLISAIELGRENKVLLLEKNDYPFHKVCGEYISNEVLPYLQRLGFDPFSYGASSINKLRISTPKGKNLHSRLDLGGFGLSRYIMDEALSKLAIAKGAELKTGIRVVDIGMHDGVLYVNTPEENYTAKLVIGSYGKRAMLDKKLQRQFIQEHTGYMGVKYHIETKYPVDEIGLDNFRDGYCGVVKIEDSKYNLCYLYKRKKNEAFASIRELEEKVLFTNPRLKELFTSSSFLSSKPGVINEICFSAKSLVENNILMCGDSAGLITPLCGNGMSMAISAAKLLSECIRRSQVLEAKYIIADKRDKLEAEYQTCWNKMFKARLSAGRSIQKMFGNTMITELVLPAIHAISPLERSLIRATHGDVIT